jgi:predicted metalloprotease with PDZ domain
MLFGRVLWGVFLCAQLSAVSAQTMQAEHLVSFPGRQNQYVDIQLSMPVSGDQTELLIPSWTPGSYLIRDYAAHVERLQARAVGGKPLDVQKVAKNRWLVANSGERAILVSYSVWAGELGTSSNWVDNDFALLNGAGLFLYTEPSRNWPQHVTVELPQDWKSISTSMPEAGSQHRYLAANYDELVDSPMLLGNANVFPFSVEGQAYALVNQGETEFWDGPKSAQDVAGVVATVQAFWGSNPLERPYLFLNVIAEGSGGLEHDHSTVLISGPLQMEYRQDYVDWLALVSHEFFHAWNVRRMRPQALDRYDYLQETYTRELWLAEGLTSYYDNLLLLRSGLISAKEYFTLLATELHTYETTPGRHLDSAEAASFDAWIKLYKPDANTVNKSVSYYRKGSIVGFATDTAMRQASEHRVSLDTLMREMYRRYGPTGVAGDGGYPAGAFQSLAGELAGEAVKEQVQTWLETTADPEIDAALAWYGLKLDRSPSRTAAAEAGQPEPTDFGLVWNKLVPNLQVEAVLRGGTGAAAGILPLDEVLAINKLRVTKETIVERMQRLVPGEKVEILLVRHGRIRTLEAAVQAAVPDKYLISIDPDISGKQKDRMEAWLGINLQFVTE